MNMNMNEENNDKIFRKLKYFLDNSILVHLTEKDGTFHNGKLKDLVLDENLVVLVDRIQGMTILPVEDIAIDSIREFKEDKRWKFIDIILEEQKE